MAERWNDNFNPSTSNSTKKTESSDKRPTTRRVHGVAQMNLSNYDLNKPLHTNSSTSGLNKSSVQFSTESNKGKSIDQFSRSMNSMPTNNQMHSQKSLSDDDISMHIKTIWEVWKRSKVLTDALRNIFETSINPYVSLLKLIHAISEDRVKGKASTLVHAITDEFYKWIKFKDSVHYEHILTDELKIEAFKMTLNKRICPKTMNTIVKIFKCNMCLDIMEGLIRESIKQKQFKEACYATISLNIQNKFTVEDFLIPLYFINLVSVTEEFLVTTKFQQEAVVKYFDNLLVEDKDCLYHLANRLNIIPINNNFSNKNQIKTNLSRIMKKYNIPSELAPHITKEKKMGALRFMFRRYRSGVTGIDGWREMAMESIGNDKDMMFEVIQMLDKYGDIQEAIYFANLFSIDSSLLSPSIQQELLFSENASAAVEKSLPFEENSTVEYHELSLSEKQIHIIDCGSKFNEFLDKINVELFDTHLNVLGLDCEWKPELTRNKSDLASIQLATVDSIYIFHIPQLQPAEHFKLHWHEFSMNIFSNINILKLGFEWKGDASMIRSTLPIDNIQLNGPGFVDIKLLWKELEVQWNLLLPYQSPNDDLVHHSLSDLVKLCFGKPLNKTEQFSNWEKIPLRYNQIKYAALDAYCLLEIYNVFKSECKANGIPFDEVCQKISNSDQSETLKPKPRNKKHKHKVQTTNIAFKSPHTHVSNVRDIKLLVPNTLEKLAERLRKCGIDTSTVERSKINDSQHIINLIETKNLYFIAFGYVFSKVAEKLRDGQCYCVQSHNLDDQVQEVLNYFKIVVQKDDLNSRCQFCNSNSYETVSNPIMKQIFDAIKSIKNPRSFRNTLYTAVDEAEDNDLYKYDEDSSDEGTNPPISVVASSTRSSIPTVVPVTKPYSQLLSGYINKNCEINIKPLSLDIFNDKNRTFNICNMCGSVSWDNSHWESALGSSLDMKHK
ncbi:Ribonuclease H-like domain,3'-5' exonuclease domain,Mut7-C RNAse domain [Cinara cedri]|uniref:Ribonuclease H-like domain,3'-5' exonuclease domain,Mut7-C RNAse domain n=1 Tax=Cinara cedri TaxID=506608 RepID=A0A5E4MQ49_9HEMI|nr:Ribonuclease H-like domain,3'-5' exonuclease domain,Mut7-C RNAse domain [Cinara cedri]